MDFTLLEVHVPNAEFNAPFAGRGIGDDEDDTDFVPSGGPSTPIAPVAALLALVGLALLARYLRGGDAEQTTLDEVEV